MKKTLSLIAVFLVAAMWSGSGSAADKYVSGSIGISWFNDADFSYIYDYEGEDNTQSIEFGSGITLLGAFGCDYGDYRIEGELGYQQNDAESLTYEGENFIDGDDSWDLEGDISVTSLLANGYYDIDLGGVELSLGAGVGVAQINMSDIEIDDDDYPGRSDEFDGSETALAYQLGAGLGIPVADNIMLDARYRYFATTDFTVVSWGNANIESHSALLGLRVGL